MMDTSPMREQAIELMREALVLLDEAGEDSAAFHLQWAHDIAARVPPMQEGDEIDFGPNPDAVNDIPPLGSHRSGPCQHIKKQRWRGAGGEDAGEVAPRLSIAGGRMAWLE